MSSVLRFPPASPQQSLTYLQAKLAYYTDAWDLAEDLAQHITDIVVIDALDGGLSGRTYLRCHLFPASHHE